MTCLVNNACLNLFGYTAPSELIGQEVDILVPANVRMFHKEKMEEYLKHPTNRSLGTARDLYGLKKDGGIVPVEIGLYLYGEYIMAVIIDITTGRKYAMSS